MKQQITEAIRQLQLIGDASASVDLNHQSKDEQKTLSACVSHVNGQPLVSFVSSSGYNSQYAKKKLSNAFNAVISAALPFPGQGDFILTRKPPLRPNENVALTGDDYYYAVNDGIIYCNGRELGVDFQARFNRTYNATCSGSGEIMSYSEFELL